MPHYATCSINEMLDHHLAADLDTIRRAEGALPEHTVGGVGSGTFYSRLRRAQELGTVRYAGLVLLNHAMFVQDLSCHNSGIEHAALRVVEPLVPGISRPLMGTLMRTQRHGDAFYATSDNAALHTLQRVLASLGFGEEPWLNAMTYLNTPRDLPPVPEPKATVIKQPPAFPYKPKTVRSY